MTGYLGKTTNRSRDIVGAQAMEDRHDLWGPIPGIITSYDAPKGTGTIQPLYKPIHNGVAVDMPQLLEVAIDMPRTAKGAITYGDLTGSHVMLTPSMRSMENYDTGGDGEPSDGRSFHLSDMRASIVGGDSLSNPLSNVDPDNVHIRFDPDGKFGIRGSPDGKIKIEGKEGNAFELLAELVELLASDTLVITHGSSSGSGHRLEFQAQYLEIAAKLRAMVL